MFKLPLLTLLGAVCVFAAGVTITPPGSAFANACAGKSYFSGLPNPGDGFSTTTDASMQCQVNIGALALASASNSGVQTVAWSNSATAEATPGSIKIGASNSGAGAAGFPGGAAYGGWNDTITLLGGTGAGVWIAPLFVEGTLTATGNGALTRMGVTAYKNDNF